MLLNLHSQLKGIKTVVTTYRDIKELFTVTNTQPGEIPIQAALTHG